MEQNGTHPQKIDQPRGPSDQPPDFNRGYLQPSPEDDIIRAPASLQDGPDDLGDLTPRQLAALPYLVAAPTLAQGARLARIGRTTLYRWMADDLFRVRFKELRSEAEELAQTELQGLLLKSTLVLAELMEDPSPRIRLRAAQAMMTAGLKAGDTRDFVKRLERTAIAVESVVNEIVDRYRHESSGRRDPPESLELLDLLREEGLAIPDVIHGVSYLDECLRDSGPPDPKTLFRLLLPGAPNPY